MTTDTVGGVWTYAVELTAALAPHGIEVVLAAMGPELGLEQRSQAARLTNARLEFRAGPLEWMTDPWTDVDASREWLHELAVREGVRLVHANTFAHCPLVPELPTIVVGHSCVASWFAAVRGCEAPPEFDEYRRRVRRSLAAADVVVAPTYAMMDALREHYGPLGRTRVISNGRRLGGFRPARKLPIVISAGRLWDDGKNVATLARAATILPWEVFVAGDARHPDGGQQRLEGVHALGALPSAVLATWLGRAAIYAAPARYEPFGLGVLEAASSGCALVLGDIASLREVWGDAATYVPPDDAGALAFAIGRIIGDSARWVRMAKAARARALRMTGACMAASYRGLYDEFGASARAPHITARAGYATHRVEA
jgi:glycosyltransferase involved in cell wall biosynthesis